MKTQLNHLAKRTFGAVEPLLPGAVHRRLMAVIRGPLRVSRVATALFGHQYTRSRTLIEIDITYACNLNCFNCNRSCQQAPTGERMTVEQIRRFIDESVAADTRWERIRILGGEPTLHLQFFEILDLLRAYRDQCSPRTRIEVCTNGYGEKVQAVIDRIPADITINNSAKETVEQEHFCSFNVAPIDDPTYADAEFENGCTIMEEYGMGLGPNGYYQCTIAAGIDRIHGWNVGRRRLPVVSDAMKDLTSKICRHCGHFKRHPEPPIHAPVMSPTWTAAYERYRRARPRLTLYGGGTSSPAAPEDDGEVSR